nr:hypothetical protein [Rhodomonas sp. NIES-1006]
MIRKKLKSKIINFINYITAFCFLYSLASTSLVIPNDLKNYDLLNANPTENTGFKKGIRLSTTLDQDPLTHKIYSDLCFYTIIQSESQHFATQLSINQEGKILGYKPTQLGFVTYSLEKQIVSLLRKNTSMSDISKNIYWLNIANKY